jgi:hypothetical protein
MRLILIILSFLCIFGSCKTQNVPIQQISIEGVLGKRTSFKSKDYQFPVTIYKCADSITTCHREFSTKIITFLTEGNGFNINLSLENGNYFIEIPTNELIFLGVIPKHFSITGRYRKRFSVNDDVNINLGILDFIEDPNQEFRMKLNKLPVMKSH